MISLPKGKLTFISIKLGCHQAGTTVTKLISELCKHAEFLGTDYITVGLYVFPSGDKIISKYLNGAQEQHVRTIFKAIQTTTVNRTPAYDVHAECKKANVSMNDLVTAMHELADNKGLTIREVGLYEYKSGTRILNNISETCANYIRAAFHMIRTPTTLKLANHYPQLHRD